MVFNPFQDLPEEQLTTYFKGRGGPERDSYL